MCLVTVGSVQQAAHTREGGGGYLALYRRKMKKAPGELTEADQADYSGTRGLSKQLQNTLWCRVGLRDHRIAGLLKDL